MQQSCTYGSVRGALGNWRPYRDKRDLNSSRLRKNECRRMFRSFCVFFGDLGDQLQMNHYGVGVPCGVFLKK